MAGNLTQSLSFTVDGQPSDTFTVFRLTGREAISELYRFEVDVVSDTPDIPLSSLAGRNATASMTRLGHTQ